MKFVKSALVASTLAVFGGCVAVPVGGGYYPEATNYYAPPPVYYAPPAYYGPSFGIGIHRGWRGGGHGRGHGHGHH